MENGSTGRVYVGSLPGHYTEKDVYREFETFGPVLKVELKKAVSEQTVTLCFCLG